MLNPSTADHMQDDPTIRRCIAFAKRENHTHLNIVNLFALRSTDPNALNTHAEPIGELNNNFILDEINKHTHIVFAWGNNKLTKGRFESLKPLLPAKTFLCLGTTNSGSPKHPLYLKAETDFEVFNIDQYTI